MKRCIQLFAGISMVAALTACNRPAATSNPSSQSSEGQAQEVVPIATRFDPSYLQHAVLDTPPGGLPRATDNGSNKGKNADLEKSPAESEAKSKATASLAGNDLNFIQRVGNDGQSEEQAALYVASKTTNNDIRNYAAQMGRERGKANQQLRKLAADKRIELPSEPSGMLRTKLDRIRKMVGVQMERAFLQDFGVQANMDAIALFELQASQAQDPELKEFASKQLPQLRERYNEGKILQQKYAPMTTQLDL
jgi:putative membrane protein